MRFRRNNQSLVITVRSTKLVWKARVGTRGWYSYEKCVFWLMSFSGVESMRVCTNFVRALTVELIGCSTNRQISYDTKRSYEQQYEFDAT